MNFNHDHDGHRAWKLPRRLENEKMGIKSLHEALYLFPFEHNPNYPFIVYIYMGKSYKKIFLVLNKNHSQIPNLFDNYP